MVADTFRNLARTELFRLISGAGALFACRLGGAVAGYATLVLLARWMGAQELGNYVFAYAWCITLTLVATLGYNTVASRFVGLSLANKDFGFIRGFVRRGRQIIATAGIVLASIGAGLILLLDDFMASAQQTPFLIALACVPVFALMRLNTSVAHSFSWFVLAFVPNTFARPLLLISAITLTWSLGIELSAVRGMLLFMACLVVSAAVQHAVLVPPLARKIGQTRPTYQTRRWIGAGLPMLIVMGFTAYFPEVSITVAGNYLPTEEIAKLNASIRTAFLIAFGLEAVDHIILPRVSGMFAHGDRRGLMALVIRANHIKFWSALAAVLGFCLFGRQILGLFGESFTDGFSALLIFSLALVVRAGAGPLTMLLMISGQQNRCIPVYACALPAHLLLNVLLVPRYGIDGAAMAMLATTLLWALWLHAVVVRHLEIRPSIFITRKNASVE